MAASTTLHDSLKSLGPVSFDSVPTSQPDLATYLQSHFSAARYILESIPHPPAPPATTRPDNLAPLSRSATSTARSRATSSASSLSEISVSSARSPTPSTEHEQLQKDWGKPLKLSDKDNPLGISVYKLPAKDGKGAWFARRSVHEGLSFERWKEGLMQEFPSSLLVEGGPGSGKVRGIGAEEKKDAGDVEGVGKAEVYHLSAQFPGPSAPRDFVTLLLTSDYVEGQEGRHYLVMSKPCDHPDYPTRNGLVRGSYESVEFIREIPRSQKASSTTESPETKGMPKEDGKEENLDANSESSTRNGGKTVAFAETRGPEAKGEAIDVPSNAGDNPDEVEHTPVEWIMVSRSDPGGSVPRFLVERGTPAGIVSDAGKFLDWACKREDSSGLEDDVEDAENTPRAAKSEGEPEPETSEMEPAVQTTSAPSLLTKAADAAYSTAENYVPKVANGLLGVGNTNMPDRSQSSVATSDLPQSPTLSSGDSFASAEEDFSDSASLPSTGSDRKLSPQEKELLRLANRKGELAEKLRETKEKGVRDKDSPTEKELARIRKAQEKHDREVTKAEERYAKATKQIEDKRRRDEAKEEERREREVKREVERRQKAERKEREQKERAEKKELEGRLKGEIEGLKKEVDTLRSEKEGLSDGMRRLQAENTKLVTMIGKLEGGERLLMELKRKDTSES